MQNLTYLGGVLEAPSSSPPLLKMNKKELNKAYKEGLIDEDKFKDELFKLETEPKKKREKRIYESVSEEDFIKIFKNTKKMTHKIAFILSYYSGLRISEVIALRPEDVNIKERKIFIRQGKGSKDRVVNSPKILKETHLKYLPLDITPRALNYAFRRISTKAKVNYPIGKYMKQGKEVPILKYHYHSLRHCVSEDTEILTIDGWKDYKSLKKNDTIYSYNIKKKRIEKDIISEIHKYQYDDKLYHIKNNYFDILVTPEHKLLLDISFYRGKGITEKPGWKLLEIDKVINEMKCKRVINQKLSSEGYQSDQTIGLAKAGLLGWILSDGNIARDKEITIHQSLSANKHKCKVIENLLKKSGVEYTKNIQKVKENKWSKKPYQMVVFRLLKGKNKKNNDWIFEFVNNDRTPKYTILELKKKELQAVYDNLMLGDGSSREYCSQNIKRIEFMQTLCIFLGKRANRGTGIHNQTNKTKYRTWICDRTKAQVHYSSFRKDIKKEKYKGIVWCPTTNNKTFIARRKNKIFITGNSYATGLLEKGVPINQVQLLLGHENLSTTSRYTKANPHDALNSVISLGM